jgi:hypothetical protein
METSITKSNFVILVCTPRYRGKANMREGGVGAEAAIVGGELFGRQDVATQAKFVPVLRGGTAGECIPSFATGRFYLDFGDAVDRAKQMESLLRHIHGQPEFSAPPLGTPPAFDRAPDATSDRGAMRAHAASSDRTASPSRRIRTAFDRSVFLGLHGDSLALPILTAAVLSVVAYGLRPRSVLEASMTQFSRLERVQALIAQCRYSIHDIGAPTQNASFELGLALGAVTSGAIERQDILVVGKERSSTMLSDFNGLDVQLYDGDRIALLRVIATFLAVRSPAAKRASPVQLAKQLPELDARVADVAAKWGGHVPPFAQMVALAELQTGQRVGKGEA